jgi:hypothetical protein
MCFQAVPSSYIHWFEESDWCPRDFDKNLTEPEYFDNKSIDISIPLKETNEIIKMTSVSP